MSPPPPSIRRLPPPSRQSAPPLAPKASTVAEPTHMLIERGTLKDKKGNRIPGAAGAQVKVLCGLTGAPYDGAKGLRTTVWASATTCVECAKHPGVSGQRLSWNELDTVPPS